MSSDRPVDRKAASILPADQEHILAHVRTLDDEAAQRLLQELEEIDWASFKKVAGKPDVSTLTPPSIVTLGERADFENEYTARGEKLFKAGAIANLIVAGGQGSRLGYEGPKGCYFLESLQKTIFEIHAGRQRAATERFGVELPLLIMTGAHNHEATSQFFADNEYFGLNKDSVHFFQQGSVPSFGVDQTLQLLASDRLLQNPNGHGGTVEALIDSGMLQYLVERGVLYINYIQVDNILARLDDTFALGLTDVRQARMLTKVVEKASPDEKVGCLVNSAGIDQIVEYSDVSAEQAKMTDAAGNLVLRWGNTAMHVISVPFLQRFQQELSLPFHVSAPKNAKVFKDGKVVEAKVRKYERFIFDLLLQADVSVGLAVKRELEFAPIKNASGSDSPESAVELYNAAL